MQEEWKQFLLPENRMYYKRVKEATEISVASFN